MGELKRTTTDNESCLFHRDKRRQQHHHAQRCLQWHNATTDVQNSNSSRQLRTRKKGNRAVAKVVFETATHPGMHESICGGCVHTRCAQPAHTPRHACTTISNLLLVSRSIRWELHSRAFGTRRSALRNQADTERTRIHTHTHMHAHTHTQAHTQTNTHTHTQAHTQTHTPPAQTHTHAHRLHTHTHTRTRPARCHSVDMDAGTPSCTVASSEPMSTPS